MQYHCAAGDPFVVRALARGGGPRGRDGLKPALRTALPHYEQPPLDSLRRPPEYNSATRSSANASHETGVPACPLCPSAASSSTSTASATSSAKAPSAATPRS